MKFLIVTFAIAALAQLSTAGPISRHKRSEAFVHIFETTIADMKTFVRRSENLFRNTLKDIPRTPAFAEYVPLFEEYVKETDELRITSGNCFEKTIAGLEKMVQFAEKVDAVDPEKETYAAKEVERILESHGGEKFANDLEAYGNKLDSLNMDKELEDLTPTDALKIVPMMMEVC